jgi:hypothetical protein
VERQVGDREPVEADLFAQPREIRDAPGRERPARRRQVAEGELQAISQAR